MEVTIIVNDMGHVNRPTEDQAFRNIRSTFARVHDIRKIAIDVNQAVLYGKKTTLAPENTSNRLDAIEAAAWQQYRDNKQHSMPLPTQDERRLHYYDTLYMKEWGGMGKDKNPRLPSNYIVPKWSDFIYRTTGIRGLIAVPMLYRLQSIVALHVASGKPLDLSYTPTPEDRGRESKYKRFKYCP